MDEVREALYRWMQHVLHERGWTASAWARRAGVTPTNVTRFLHDPEKGSVPGGETLGRLARAAGSEPRFLPEPIPPGRRVPLLSTAQIGDLLAHHGHISSDTLDTLPPSPHGVTVDGELSPHAFAVTVGTDHQSAAGVLRGDRIVLEPPDVRPAATGDLVVTFDRGDNQICAYRFHPPWLLPATVDPACTPLLAADATFIGTGVLALRVLRHDPDGLATSRVAVRAELV